MSAVLSADVSPVRADLPAHLEADPPAPADHSRRRSAQVVRHRAGATSRCRATIRVLARGSLPRRAESGSLALDDDLGFVILHRCGESFYFLIVSTWRNDNEALGDGLGEERRGRGLLPALDARGDAPPDASASGSSARSGTSSRRGAAFSARRVEPLRARPTCATRSEGQV